MQGCIRMYGSKHHHPRNKKTTRTVKVGCFLSYTHTHTHTHIYIYIRFRTAPCVCIYIYTHTYIKYTRFRTAPSKWAAVSCVVCVCIRIYTYIHIYIHTPSKWAAVSCVWDIRQYLTYIHTYIHTSIFDMPNANDDEGYQAIPSELFAENAVISAIPGLQVRPYARGCACMYICC